MRKFRNSNPAKQTRFHIPQRKRNVFYRWGAYLVSLAIAGTGFFLGKAKAEENQNKKLLGMYNCEIIDNGVDCLKSDPAAVKTCIIGFQWIKENIKPKISVCDNYDGDVIFSMDNLNRFDLTKLGQEEECTFHHSNKKFKLDCEDDKSFLKISGSRFGDHTLSFRWEVFLSKNDKPILRKIWLMCTFDSFCPNPNLRKAVFIRPCEGQLYKSFDTQETRIGGGTVGSVCDDLKKSGVTDVFISFKADDETNAPTCGTYGKLLYDSEYDDHEHGDFKGARDDGFDPIKALIDACKSKGMRVHAWFPVFSDREIIEDLGEEAGQKAVSIPVWYNPFSWWDVEYSSTFANPENPDVVEYELSLLREIVQKYRVNGINLDYIRYADAGDFSEGRHVVVISSAITDFVRKVREEFPEIELSADVRAGHLERLGVGQHVILTYLDIIMPMTYTKSFGFGDHREVKSRVIQLKLQHSDKILMPILRGWRVEQDNNGLLSDLKNDIEAAKESGSNGYGIFTYEALLFATGKRKLDRLKEKIGF